jgi:hypothetical protein
MVEARETIIEIIVVHGVSPNVNVRVDVVSTLVGMSFGLC